MVRCKFVCWDKKTQDDGAVSIHLQAVCEGSEENKEFFKYTPAGCLAFHCVNPKAAEQIVPGVEYYIDIQPAI